MKKILLALAVFAFVFSPLVPAASAQGVKGHKQHHARHHHHAKHQAKHHGKHRHAA
jgi:Ni/Co efflux regulator RcnB